MRSHETNMSSADSSRHPSRPIGIPASSTHPVPSSKSVEAADNTLSTTPNDVYQQVYHDDSSTHGSRTLDSRFSRDKYDLSDGGSTDDDEDNEHEEQQQQPSAQPIPSSSREPVDKSVDEAPPSVVPTSTSIAQHNDKDHNHHHRTELDQTINSKRVSEIDELDKGKSPGDERANLHTSVHDENEKNDEEDHSESNHKEEHRVSLEIYHNSKKKEKQKTNETDAGERYSASLKMYLNTRQNTGGAHSISITPKLHEPSDRPDEANGDADEDEAEKQHRQRLYSLQIGLSTSMDFTHSPSSSSSSSLLEPAPKERLIGSSMYNDPHRSPSNTASPPSVLEVRGKPYCLPPLTGYIEYIDRRVLPAKDSLSWQDDTIGKDQTVPLSTRETSDDPMELARQVIESILTKIDDEERQLLATVDRLVEQACSRALSLYLMERRVQLFAGSSHLPHHKSCMLRTGKADNDRDNCTDANSSVSRLRTKSSPVLAATTDWTDVSRKLAAQTCFAAYPSGSNIHELNRSDFSTFSEAKLKFFNIISSDVIPSRSSVSLPLAVSAAPHVLSSSSSTRSSRASSVSSYASSMHVPCPPLLDNQSKRHQRPLSARLLDFSDDSDSKPTASISASLKTSVLPSIAAAHSQPLPAPSSLPPPAVRTQRRHQQPKRRSSEDLNSSSDDSLSNHLNKAAGFRSVVAPRSHHNK